MKELNLNQLKSVELGKAELIEINGGKVAYMFPTNTQDADNEYIVFMCHMYNIAANIRNWFGD